ncbi:MAG: hypothetical protein GCPPV2_gp2 [Guiyang permutotetra-like virus 2]|nr:MAG: hypothetical protein GCPPV2_gp2 [Guiyang permutotetra-like virus 2]
MAGNRKATKGGKKGVEVTVDVKSSTSKAPSQKPKKPRGPKPQKMSATHHRVSGNDYFGTITMKSSDAMGALKGQVAITPRAWRGTRVYREAQLWQRWRPVSLQIEAVSSASKMMAGQYVLCWTADPDDEAPPTSQSALAKYLSMTPSVVKAIHQNARIKIPCQTTQKWYYVEGNEDKDCEYGKVWFAVAAPLANVTAGSTASVMMRIKWTLEFSMPALPPETTPDQNMVFASAPNYFTDSSGDWKDGKYLTFKWKEGGRIVSFPGAEPNKPYKTTADVTYYLANGTVAKTSWAVCVPETQEDGLPMLAPMKSETDAMAWCKKPQDNLFIGFSYAGPWITPENPPWFEKTVSLDLIVSRRAEPERPAQIKTDATIRTSDTNSERTYKILQKLVGKEKITPDLVVALQNLAKLSFTGIGSAEALSTFNYDPVRAHEDSQSSIEVLDLPGPSSEV